MRKLTVLMHISLDGFASGINGETDWMIHDGGAVFLDADGSDTTNICIFGRTTYDMMKSFWPSVTDNPESPEGFIAIANWMNNATKYVVSGSLKTSDWENTLFINNNVVSEVKKLKEISTSNILIMGSISIVHLLAKANLIDEYALTITPVVLGEGVPLFKQRAEVELTSSKTYPSGVISANYVVKK